MISLLFFIDQRGEKWDTQPSIFKKFKRHWQLSKQKKGERKKVIVSFGALPVANCPIWNIPGKKKLILSYLSPFIFIFPFVSFLSWYDEIIKHTRNFGLASFWGWYFWFFNVGCPLCVYFDSCEIPLDSFLHLEEMKLLVSCTHTHTQTLMNDLEWFHFGSLCLFLWNDLTCWIYCRHPTCSRKETIHGNHLLLRNEILDESSWPSPSPRTCFPPPISIWKRKEEEEKRPYCPEIRVLCPRYLFRKCLSYSHKKIVKDAKEKKRNSRRHFKMLFPADRISF